MAEDVSIHEAVVMLYQCGYPLEKLRGEFPQIADEITLDETGGEVRYVDEYDIYRAKL
jgi:hypothetical protein